MRDQDLAIERLRALEPILGAEWLQKLEERKVEEARFHDDDRQDHRDEDSTSTSNRKFYEATAPVKDHIAMWFARHVPGSVFLDYACGNGLTTIAAAKAGARLAVGIDISAVSVLNAASNAQAQGCRNTTAFLQRDCENTELPADSFDTAMCGGMLHHVDLNRAFPELNRIVRPGGRILCVEALSYNPAIQLYRNLTPHLRTAFEKEHILGLKDLRLARKWFRVENVRYFCMLSPLSAFVPKPLRKGALALSHGFDAVLTRIPGLQLWSWQFAFELVRPA